ncbi:hypothetical protein Tco_1016509 [Tanacetum coccineum]|uniref:Uncharacterized protein n=1 Tax=Tanacetum coccineum TaxID=301880 RepID=A0ABQ5FPV1_9ASTR
MPKAHELLEKVQPNNDYNDTYVVEKANSDVIHDSSDMSTNKREVDQNAEEPEDERVFLASLIANLKLDVYENKKIHKQLKQANTCLTQELDKSKRALRDCKIKLSRTLANSTKFEKALKDEMSEDLKYVQTLEKEVDDLKKGN